MDVKTQRAPFFGSFSSWWFPKVHQVCEPSKVPINNPFFTKTFLRVELVTLSLLARTTYKVSSIADLSHLPSCKRSLPPRKINMRALGFCPPALDWSTGVLATYMPTPLALSGSLHCVSVWFIFSLLHSLVLFKSNNYKRSFQVRPARLWRARNKAHAQKTQYVHNCYVHAAEINKWR